MLSLEEYIEKRKTEDGINEFDVSQKINNIRTCINYIFEYFDQYLSIQGGDGLLCVPQRQEHFQRACLTDTLR